MYYIIVFSIIHAYFITNKPSVLVNQRASENLVIAPDTMWRFFEPLYKSVNTGFLGKILYVFRESAIHNALGRLWTPIIRPGRWLNKNLFTVKIGFPNYLAF